MIISSTVQIETMGSVTTTTITHEFGMTTKYYTGIIYNYGYTSELS